MSNEPMTILEMVRGMKRGDSWLKRHERDSDADPQFELQQDSKGNYLWWWRGKAETTWDIGTAEQACAALEKFVKVRK